MFSGVLVILHDFGGFFVVFGIFGVFGCVDEGNMGILGYFWLLSYGIEGFLCFWVVLFFSCDIEVFGFLRFCLGVLGYPPVGLLWIGVTLVLWLGCGLVFDFGFLWFSLVGWFIVLLGWGG